MDTKFVINDYVLVWNLLFGASISESVHKLKQKLWDTYRIEYNNVFNDKNQIMKDYKNFIPDNDTIYNIVMETKDYDRLRKQLEKYRIELMQIWDKNKKETDYLYKNILRMNYPKYNFFVVNKELNIIDHIPDNNLIIGRELDKKEPLKILLEINLKIVKSKTKHYKEEYECFKKAILELAIINEYPTRITGRSYYQNGNPAYLSLKRCLYPYWLMYLGVPKEELEQYMMRDKIVFDVHKYAYEKELKKMDIEEFIDFCIRNKRYIVRETKDKKEEIL